jgi:hypothetical protein
MEGFIMLDVEFLQMLTGLDKKIDLLKLNRSIAIDLGLTIDTIKQAIQAVEDGEGGYVVSNILADYYVDDNMDAYRLLDKLNWSNALKI